MQLSSQIQHDLEDVFKQSLSLIQTVDDSVEYENGEHDSNFL